MVISIASQKGGVGKTSSTISLAAGLARKGSDLSFTKRVYVHPDPQSLKAGSEKLGELLG